MKVRRISSKTFHRRALRDTRANFERGETTLSHVLRDPGPLLGGRAYGAAFYEALRRHCLDRPPAEVVEIGAGTGDFAHAFIETWSAEAPRAGGYTIVELSQALADAQRERLAASPIPVRHHLADAERFEFEALGDGARAGVFIANEMLADLDAWRVDRKAAEGGTPIAAADLELLGATDADFEPRRIAACLARFSAHDLLTERRTYFPGGLAHLLERLRAVLAPGATVVLTEYFVTRGGGAVARMRGHSEVAFNLDLVAHVARRAGFAVHASPLIDFLDLDLSHPIARRDLLEFARTELGHDLSPTTPFAADALAWVLESSPAHRHAAFGRAELAAFAGQFHVLVLRPARRLHETDFTPELVLARDPTVMKLAGANGDRYLVTPCPFTWERLNETGEFVWDRIDGRRTLGEIGAALGDAFEVGAARAGEDVRGFALRLHARYRVA